MIVSYPNPLQQEHLVLLKIRNEIIEKFPKSRVEIFGQSIKAEYTVVSVKIITAEGEGSVFNGHAPSGPDQIVSLLRAEIVGLTMAAGELGIEIGFDGDPVAPKEEDIDPVVGRVKFDWHYVRTFREIKDLFARMSQLGMNDEIDRLKDYRMNLIKDNQKFTINKAADFLYPKKAKISLPVEEKPERKSRKKEKEPEIPPEPKPELKVAQRSAVESQELLTRLRKAGITDDTIREKTEFKRLQSFAVGATDEDVEKLFSA